MLSLMVLGLSYTEEILVEILPTKNSGNRPKCLSHRMIILQVASLNKSPTGQLRLGQRHHQFYEYWRIVDHSSK